MSGNVGTSQGESQHFSCICCQATIPINPVQTNLLSRETGHRHWRALASPPPHPPTICNAHREPSGGRSTCLKLAGSAQLGGGVGPAICRRKFLSLWSSTLRCIITTFRVLPDPLVKRQFVL